MIRLHAPRVFAEQDAARLYKRQYRALVQRFAVGSVDAVTASYAAGAAVAWVRFQDAALRVRCAQEQRDRGKGRRPTAAAVERLRRREGLAWLTFDSAVKRLEELAKTSTRGGLSLADLAVDEETR